MAALGMDVEQAERLASFVQRHSDDISALIKKVQDQIDDLNWFGPDADKFRANDVPAILVLLKSVSTSARDFADDARNNLSEQRRISGV
jgi:hypothetical protein